MVPKLYRLQHHLLVCFISDLELTTQVSSHEQRSVCSSKTSSSLAGGYFDLGVLFTHCHVIGSCCDTPLICDQWERQREPLKKCTELENSNKQAVFITAGCQWEVQLVASLRWHAVPTSGVSSACAFVCLSSVSCLISSRRDYLEMLIVV